MAPIHTLNGVLDPPPNSRQSVKARYCPGMRSCWNFNLSTFNPLNRDRADTIRRICMLVALGSHTAFDLLTLFLLTITFNAVGLFITLILSLIGFFFLAGCLATIGNAEGERIVLGKTVTRWHFDIFLMFCACVYGAAFLGFFVGMTGLSGLVLGLLPLPLWILIFIVAWVATWDTTPTPLSLA